MTGCKADQFPQAALDAMVDYSARPVDDDGHTDCYYAGMLAAAIEAMGFTYEYRAVVHPFNRPQEPAPLTKWDRSELWARGQLEEWFGRGTHSGWIERRLVGPTERMEDE